MAPLEMPAAVAEAARRGGWQRAASARERT